MSTNNISTGVVHKVPEDLKREFGASPRSLEAWEDITPLARNEWLCWIESARVLKRESADFVVGQAVFIVRALLNLPVI